MNSETLLEVRGLYKSYSEVKVLNDVSLSVGKGSITGLIGENGAGKSTLIKCINGVTRPDSGEIIFQGRALNPSGEPTATEAKPVVIVGYIKASLEVSLPLPPLV